MFLQTPRPLNQALIWVVPILALIALLTVQLLQLNQPLFQIINTPSTQGFSAELWESLTILGDGLVALTLLLPLSRLQPKLALTALVAGLIAALWVHLFKGLFAVPRPAAILGQDQMTQLGPLLKRGSFPSGHTATLFVLLGCLALWLDRWALSRIYPLVFTLGVLAALSRVAVGAHWPMDILFGATIGWLSALGARFLLRQYTASPIVNNWLGRLLTLCALYFLLAQDTGYPLAQPLQHGLAVLSLGLTSLLHLSEPAPQADPYPTEENTRRDPR